MHRHDAARLRRDRFLDGVHVHVEVFADIDEDRLRAGEDDRGDRCEKRVRDGDHFIARSDSGGDEREMQRVKSAVHADGVLRAAVVGEIFFEVDELLAKDQIALRQRAEDCRFHFVFEPLPLRVRLDESHFVGHRNCFSLMRCDRRGDAARDRCGVESELVAEVILIADFRRELHARQSERSSPIACCYKRGQRVGRPGSRMASCYGPLHADKRAG